MSEFWLARDDERGNPKTVWQFQDAPRVASTGGNRVGWIDDGPAPNDCCLVADAMLHFGVTELPGKGEAKRYTVTTACVETVKAEEGKPCM